MKSIDDIIVVHLNHMGMKSDVNGKIAAITYEKVTVQTGHNIFLEFDAETGEIINDDAADKAYIDIDEIDVPENPFVMVQYRMGAEGFAYCFDGYSDWQDIKDPMFHKLRENFLLAKKALEMYVNNKVT
jgi:hypothetical protein